MNRLLFLWMALVSSLAPAAPAPAEAKVGPRNLSADGSLANPTDEELRAFLRPAPATAPPAMLASFETAPGFGVQLVAAEPLIRSPIVAVFDEDGGLYVGEMTDYPYNTNQPVKVAWQDERPPSDGTPLGTVRLLRDTDGDGVFDRSTIFAAGLLWPGGIQPWKGGVFVAAPPEICYFKDTDGDGKADIRKKVFTGFGTENQQGGVNSLMISCISPRTGLRDAKQTDTTGFQSRRAPFKFLDTTGGGPGTRRSGRRLTMKTDALPSRRHAPSDPDFG